MDAESNDHSVNQQKSGFQNGERNRQCLFFLSTYALMFIVFIIVPIVLAILLSFTFFDTIQPPVFNGLKNYITLLTEDDIFMRYVIPNTIQFAVIVGPGGYILSFMLAWMLAQLPKAPRTVFALIIYSPSMTGGVAMSVVWQTIFSGDLNGYLNSLLLSTGVIQEAVQWLQDPHYLMTIMIVVTLWGSMGVGFLAMLAGILEVNPELYEAGSLDGISNRFQDHSHHSPFHETSNAVWSGDVNCVDFSSRRHWGDLPGANQRPNMPVS
jgi:multiple sugar transport system permease protein